MSSSASPSTEHVLSMLVSSTKGGVICVRQLCDEGVVFPFEFEYICHIFQSKLKPLCIMHNTNCCECVLYTTYTMAYTPHCHYIIFQM